MFAKFRFVQSSTVAKGQTIVGGEGIAVNRGLGFTSSRPKHITYLSVFIRLMSCLQG